ncbi:MAG: DUF4332 domain-containing protein [Leptolyngbyaceae cyanobacterium CRU_2_3]|nr:DUF4332 domain-containing protein [Leptolyngbyaceae cyanobacterium CRU_2_3]
MKPPRPLRQNLDRPTPCISSNWAIAQLPGITPQDEADLVGCGIHTTFQLLQKAQTPAQRQLLATEMQTHIQHVNKWVALSNLARIPTVGWQYCGLLLHAGVSSPAQLSQMPIARLHRQILKLQVATLQRPDLCPGVGEISQWIEQARQITHPASRSKAP